MLEFLVWLVLGRDVLETFFAERCTVNPRSPHKTRDDHFYTLKYSDQGRPVGAEIKDVVLRYIERLEEKLVMTKEMSVKQVLDVVVDGMLVIDSSQRLSAVQVARVLMSISIEV